MMLRRENSGSILVFVLVSVALVTGLALITGAFVRSRSTFVGDAITRAQLRHAAFSAAAMTAWAIDADTNGVDTMLEPWGEAKHLGDAVVTVADEKARIQFQSAGVNTIGFLMTYATDLRGEEAVGQARMLENWWNEIKTTETNRVLGAEEEILFAPSANVEALSMTLPFITVLGDGKVNINTIPREVFISMVLNTGADIGVAEVLYDRVIRSRRRGEWFASLEASEAGKLLAGEGDQLSPKELTVMQTLLPKLCVESGLFRITAQAERNGIRRTVQCVYERGTGKILRWGEF